MGTRRSATGAITLALIGVVATPTSMYLVTGDLFMAAAGVLGGLVLAWVILYVGMATQSCPNYLSGVALVLSGGDSAGGGSGSYTGWGTILFPAVCLIGIVARIVRSADPIEKALGFVGFVVGLLAAWVVLIVAVMAFGDLVDWLLRKRRGRDRGLGFGDTTPGSE